jgi:hypothetical protein
MGDWPGRQLLGAVRVSFAGEYAYTWEATGDEFQKLMGEVAGNEASWNWAQVGRRRLLQNDNGCKFFYYLLTDTHRTDIRNSAHAWQANECNLIG